MTSLLPGHLVKLRVALAEDACKECVENLNQLLADTIALRDLYKKHHWQVAGPTFYQLHLLFDEHYGQQNKLVDKNRGARATAWRPQHRNGLRHGGHDADPPSAKRT
jgi:hypothetical protein